MNSNLNPNLDPQVWVIMPVLNEAENLRWLLPQLRQLPFGPEVVVVDNGCTDDSVVVAKRFGCHVVACKTRGYGSAVQSGMKYALTQAKEADTYASSILVVFDADGSSPVDQIAPAIAPVAAGEASLVIAQRIEIETGAMPLHARVGNWLQVALIELATGFKYTDMGPLRALTFEVYERLCMEDPTWGWNVEMQMKAAMLGVPVRQFGISYRRRRYGRSKISGSIWGSVRAGTRILMATWVYFWKAKQMKNLGA